MLPVEQEEGSVAIIKAARGPVIVSMLVGAISFYGGVATTLGGGTAVGSGAAAAPADTHDSTFALFWSDWSVTGNDTAAVYDSAGPAGHGWDGSNIGNSVAGENEVDSRFSVIAGDSLGFPHSMGALVEKYDLTDTAATTGLAQARLFVNSSTLPAVTSGRYYRIYTRILRPSAVITSSTDNQTHPVEENSTGGLDVTNIRFINYVDSGNVWYPAIAMNGASSYEYVPGANDGSGLGLPGSLGDPLYKDSVYMVEFGYNIDASDSMTVQARIYVVRSGTEALLYDTDDWVPRLGASDSPHGSANDTLHLIKFAPFDSAWARGFRVGQNQINAPTYSANHDMWAWGGFAICDTLCGVYNGGGN